MADRAQTLALSAAVRVLAKITRAVVAQHTREGAAAVNTTTYGPGVKSVRIGRPGGQWGWVPIQAWMLDNDGRHPFFGDRGRWYAENVHNQPVTGMLTGEAARAGADAAVAAFADTYVAEKFK